MSHRNAGATGPNYVTKLRRRCQCDACVRAIFRAEQKRARREARNRTVGAHR